MVEQLKFCKDCRHHRPSSSGKTEEDICHRTGEEYQCLITGRTSLRNQHTCELERNSICTSYIRGYGKLWTVEEWPVEEWNKVSPCGREAKHFEPSQFVK